MLRAVVKLYGNGEMKLKIYVKLTEPVKINTGLRQDCQLPPTVLKTHTHTHTHTYIYIYIYINQIIIEWKEEEIKGIKISRNKDIKTLWFADDQFIMAGSEDALLISAHELLTVTNEQGLKNLNKQN